tara:strand:- start:1315 stop:2034 length:720 start_codon:yes stop_codon:yes gene_type:complete
MKYQIYYNINNIKYSNTQGRIGDEFSEEIKKIGNSIKLKNIKKLVNIIDKYPENLSNFTINEINILLDKQNKRDAKIYYQILKEAYEIDDTFKKYMLNNNVDEEIINKVYDTIPKIIYKIDLALYVVKKFYDRVRPSILSKELLKHNIIDDSIKPWIKLPTHPAYPSGHATQSMFLAEYFSNYYPQYRQCFENAAEEISVNREIAGLHYRSDTIAGYKLGKFLAIEYLKNNQTTFGLFD